MVQKFSALVCLLRIWQNKCSKCRLEMRLQKFAGGETDIKGLIWVPTIVQQAAAQLCSFVFAQQVVA